MSKLTHKQLLLGAKFSLQSIEMYVKRTIKALEAEKPLQARTEVNYVLHSVQNALREIADSGALEDIADSDVLQDVSEEEMSSAICQTINSHLECAEYLVQRIPDSDRRKKIQREIFVLKHIRETLQRKS